MAFAVVAFDDEEESYSEVPVSWLTKNNTMCWWPKSKTPSNYMIRGVKPNPSSWILCKVKVEGFYPTLEKARKMAQDKEYTSSEEINTRKRKRKRYSDIEYQDSTTDEEHSTTRSVTPPPQMIQDTVRVIDLNNVPFMIEGENIAGFSGTNSSSKNELVTETITDNDMIPEQCNVPVLVPLSDTASTTLLSDSISTSNTGVTLDKIYELLVSTNLYVKNIATRLEKLENANKVVDHSENIKDLRNKLPLNSITNINQFEEFISDNENHKMFVKFISTIGGREVKDNIHRCLKTLFTNDIATKCSWLGQRGNFRICNLASITAVKDVMQSTYTITEKLFEVICSEWFRIAKLRMKPKHINQNQVVQ